VADPRVVLTPPSTKGPGRWDIFSKHEVTPWSGPSRAVIAGEGNGASAVADPRVAAPKPLDLLAGTRQSWYGGAYGITAPWLVGPTVTGATSPANGRFSYADPIDGSGFGRYGVLGPSSPSGTVTGEAFPSTGAFSYADPRVDLLDGSEGWHHDILGVVTDGDVLGTVTGRAGATTGRFSYAAPAPLDLRPQAGNDRLHWNKYVVVPWDDASKTVTGATRVGSGATSAADPRIHLALHDSAFHHGPALGRWGILTPLDVANTVTGNARVNTGAFSIAVDIPVDLTAPGVWRNRYGVLGLDEQAATVTGNARLHTGRFSIAAKPPAPVDLLPHKDCYDAGYGVLRYDQPSRTVAASADVGCGAYAIATEVPPLVPVDLTPEAVKGNPERVARYGVLRQDQPSRTITGQTSVGCGAYAIATEVPSPIRLELSCSPRADAYGVQGFQREAATITAHFKVDNSRAAVADPRLVHPEYVVLSYEETKRIVDGEVQIPFAIVDPEFPTEPLAIVESLESPPFRWVEHVTESVTKAGKVVRKVKRVRETVALVLISADGTWHRPLTTLELAVLQAFPAEHKGKPLDFGVPPGARGDVATTRAREVVGNAVPPAVARAMAEQMLLSLTVAAGAAPGLGEPGTPVWVRQVRALEEQLRGEGFTVAIPGQTMNFTTGEQLDDGALVWRKAKTKKPKKATRRAARHDVALSRDMACNGLQ
jgi:site-specific DNA-cytosine methylase